MTATIGIFWVVSAFSSSPRTAENFFTRGLEKQKQQESQAAIADFDQAIRLKPDYIDAYYSRGHVRYVLGDNKGAIADFDQAIKLDPYLAYAYNNRGNARSALGDKPGAIADLQKAVELYRKQGNNEKWLQGALNRIKELQQ